MSFNPDELSAKERIVMAGMVISGTFKYPAEYLAMTITRLVQVVADDDPRYDTVYDSTVLLKAIMDKVMVSIATSNLAKQNGQAEEDPST